MPKIFQICLENESKFMIISDPLGTYSMISKDQKENMICTIDGEKVLLVQNYSVLFKDGFLLHEGK